MLLNVKSSIYLFIFWMAMIIWSCQPVKTTTDSEEIKIEETFAFQPLLVSNELSEPEHWDIASSVLFDRGDASVIEKKEGSGVLVANIGKGEEHVFQTEMEHGDVELSLDFMLSPGAEAGIYLMGRYRLQLADSWEEEELSYQSCGGIYPTSSMEANGVAPEINVCRAPGLWQHLYVHFNAPRFNDAGEKVSNAVFEEVRLNGVKVQRHISLKEPSDGALFEEESNSGTLTLKVTDFPTAFKNFAYKRYGTDKVNLSDISYQLYEGKFDELSELTSLESTRKGEIDSITYELGEEFENYALVFEGSMNIPVTGEYLVALSGNNHSYLEIDGNSVIINDEHKNSHNIAKTRLEEGIHTFELTYNKNRQRWRRGLGWFIEGPELKRAPLHANSSIPKQDPPPPYEIKALEEPAFQRGFYYHYEEKRTHVLAVGLPEAVNYVYDLSSATLLSAWKGRFADATNMWHNRGNEQTLKALGGELTVAQRPSFASWDEENPQWPDSLNGFSILQYQGYSLTPDGIPSFEFSAEGIIIRDITTAYEQGKGINRTINYQSSPSTSLSQPLYFLIASAKSVEAIGENEYLIDDKAYYLKVEKTENTEIIQHEEEGQLLLMVPIISSEKNKEISYSIIW